MSCLFHYTVVDRYRDYIQNSQDLSSTIYLLGWIGKFALLLADEPTGNLDEENRMEIMKLLADLNRNGMTIIMVTHDMDLLQYATRVCQMSDGRLV